MEQLFIQNFSFWNKISIEEQNSLLKNSKIVTYSKGQTIYSANNECLGLIFVVSGELRTYMLSDEGREVTLYRLKQGEMCILSASCILKNITFDVFIDAEQDSQVLLINFSTFDKIQKSNVYAENFALKVVVEKFSDVMWSMEQILFYKFEKRLAVFLLDECNINNTDTIKLTHEQIAKYIGSAREVVSRTLKKFEKMDIVSLKNSQIVVLDKQALLGLNN